MESEDEEDDGPVRSYRWTEGTAKTIRDTLSGIDLRSLAWADGASCYGADPDAWFAVGGGVTQQVRRVCANCEVRDACLEWALDHDERGYWGNTTREERLKMIEQRGR